jgi:RpiB/LacA/LacB family sugar-phosphate isomerase
MKIALASDHAGYELKEEIKQLLGAHEMIDFGTDSTCSMDYPDSGFPAAEAVAKGNCERGILICGTGIGMSILANKVKGIRAALCHCTDFARLSRQHNNANILVLPGKFLTLSQAEEIINTWLTTPFEGGRHERRIQKIREYEETVS